MGLEREPMRYHLTRKSGNSKTGKIPVSTTSSNTCPKACPFNVAGTLCYAKGGKLSLHWGRVDKSGVSFEVFADALRKLPVDQLWRHNQAGDLPGEGDTLDVPALAALVSHAAHTKGYTYTHKPLRTAQERLAVRSANALVRETGRGLTINLSANSPAHADTLAELQVGPVVCVLPSDAPRISKTPAGRTIVVCPAQLQDLTCEKCGICQRPGRKAIVGFLAHGVSHKKVSLTVLQSVPSDS